MQPRALGRSNDRAPVVRTPAPLSSELRKPTNSFPFRATAYFPQFGRRKFGDVGGNRPPQPVPTVSRAVFKPHGDPTIETGLFPSRQVADGVKRVIDVIVACALFVFVLPLMALISLAIKVDSHGPIIYRQERVDLDGRRFMLLKFRSMRPDAEPDGRPVWATADDRRVTRVGRIIRLTRIDELPQLFNVLRGEMSLVGPRPERPFFVEELSGSIPSFTQRHQVKPGITGWAQIKYPYCASVNDARNKLAFDLYYINKRSLFLDLLILAATVRVVILRQGAR